MFYYIWSPLSPILSKTEKTFPPMHEWWFRTKLDHFAPVWGMFYAMLHPSVESYMDRLERRGGSYGLAVKVSRSVSRKFWTFAKTKISNHIPIEIFEFFLTFLKSGIVGVASMIFYWWVTQICSIEDKVSYNQLHPYFSFIPTFYFILIRNISASARKYYCHLLTICGKITLETYIAQFHIFLNSDTKTLLVLLEGYPLVNCFVVTVIYIWASYQLFHITAFLAEYLIPNDLTKVGKTWGTIVGVFVAGCILNRLIVF
jgi:hypothetical protein